LVVQAVAAYEQISLRFVDVDLAESLRVADAQGLYAYDAYLVVCARRQRCPLLTLDRGLARAAAAAGVEVLAVT
jgi:predicted nucleic acid-binding protein